MFASIRFSMAFQETLFYLISGSSSVKVTWPARCFIQGHEFRLPLYEFTFDTYGQPGRTGPLGVIGFPGFPFLVFGRFTRF